MSKTRTIEWASVAGWVSENEQQIRDVMKFEGLKGAMVEVLRLAPDQPELAALREELATANGCLEEWRRSKLGSTLLENTNLQQRLADAERRNAGVRSVLERMLEDDDMPVHWFAQRIDVALNPKPDHSGGGAGMVLPDCLDGLLK